MLQLADVRHRRPDLNGIRLGDGFARIRANLSPPDVLIDWLPPCCSSLIGIRLGDGFARIHANLSLLEALTTESSSIADRFARVFV